MGRVLAGLFPDDGSWVWRRRVAVASSLVMMAGIVNSIFFDRDLAHSTMVMDRCQEGLALVLTIFVAGYVIDSHSRRKAESQAQPPTRAPS
jgi:hypothetical protein